MSLLLRNPHLPILPGIQTLPTRHSPCRCWQSGKVSLPLRHFDIISVNDTCQIKNSDRDSCSLFLPFRILFGILLLMHLSNFLHLWLTYNFGAPPKESADNQIQYGDAGAEEFVTSFHREQWRSSNNTIFFVTNNKGDTPGHSKKSNDTGLVSDRYVRCFVQRKYKGPKEGCPGSCDFGI